MSKYFLGIDVGTGSARAALVDSAGKIIAVSVAEIKTFQSVEGHLEQSSDNIFDQITFCVKDVIKKCSNPNLIHGIGVCATCSLVAIDQNGEPVSVSLCGKEDQNVILWMDHRAKKEAAIINRTGHEILKFVGGQVSLEMEMPKVLWMKRNLGENFKRVQHFFDLPDFITWKLTGKGTRSICSLVCKWNYDGINLKWCEDFLQTIGLEELTLNNFDRLGNEIQNPGEPIQGGLSEEIAKIFGLRPGIAVASSMIDAHCGALGVLGCQLNEKNDSNSINSKLAIIAGTSSCHMSITQMPLYVDGIWGPYYSVILPGYCHEAGQSASGVLLDFIIESHPAYSTLKNNFLTRVEIVKHLNELIIQMQVEQGFDTYHELTKDIHVYPDYHGNRSPLANPDLRGMICGLTLESDERNLAKIYLAAIQGLAYNTKHIIDQLYAAGREKFTEVLICGGLSKNHVYVQTHADVLGMPIGLPCTSEPVLLGGAILGAYACKTWSSLEEASRKLCGKAQEILPDIKSFAFHEKKYKVFHKMLECQLEIQRIMN
uniref:CSON000325 protein n=1 Tax=Culicoides sonorensis TaxID=179676 RepID=A0A336KXV5_CULSO